ncbi:HAD-IA family hydrolase [Amycolatopsis alkalitolerans]|uniref:HAD-IA family hydrolase n=1 Tax=Amycolatopsis alkalitolerans TaxID=2547244 RepID=A0A5C4M2N6_9PSEU|nr:HAD-IA family hydrolase [Amycolatopsis alkalitolerans]TNC25872.1 HAD-IA family hydrolase [Amycolatopsis alkalitolerans]
MSHEPFAAVVFDVDGTLVDSERDGHRPSFNAAFAANQLPYSWDVGEYGRLLDITGGRRRLAAYLESRGHDASEAADLAARLHRDKTERMRDLVTNGGIAARPGLRELLRELTSAGVRLAVATTGTREWVEPLLDRLFGPDLFEEVVTGTEIRALKPDPAVYLEVLRRLGLPASRAVAVEDSANGLRAAVAAGLSCVVVTNDYTRRQNFTGAAAVYPGFAACRADHGGPLSAGIGVTGRERVR